MGLDPFAAVMALHRLTIFHHLLKLLYPLVLLLEHLAPLLHFLQSRGQVLIGLNQLTIGLTLRRRHGVLKSNQQCVMQPLVFVQGILQE